MKTQDIENQIMQLGEKDTLNPEEWEALSIWSRHKDSYVRALVAETLVCFPKQQAENLLLRLARDRVAFVRTEAYDSLAAFGSKKVFEVLSSAVQGEKNCLARYYAIISLTEVILRFDDEGKRRSAQESFLHGAEEEKDHGCRLAYFNARYQFGETGVLTDIMQFLRDPDYHLRYRAVATLSDLKHGTYSESEKAYILQSAKMETVLPLQEKMFALLK